MIVTALAVIVVVVTAYVLSKPAQTLVKDTYCGIEEHTHSEECYSQELVCGYADIEQLPAEGQDIPGGYEASAEPVVSESHQHDATCYVEEKVLICGQEENAGHVHTDECKNVTESRELICTQEESAGHTHTDACKKVSEKQELTCTQEEGETHSHTDACYTVKQVEELICGQEESTGHTHTDTCYTVTQKEEFLCGQEESAGHSHEDSCYEIVRKLVCGKEETAAGEDAGQDLAEGSMDAAVPDSENGAAQPVENAAGLAEGAVEPTEDAAEPLEGPAGTMENAAEGTVEGTQAVAHVHTEACYAEVLTCKAVEHTHIDQCYQEVYCGIMGHTHGSSCFDTQGNLICMVMEHVHTDNCYKEPHCGITAHVHGADCFDADGNFICGKEEHIHTDECYISNTFYCMERIHSHSNDCYDLEGKLLCGDADYLIHIHDENCYDKNERLICPMTETEEGELHTHTEECYGVRGVLVCGQIQLLRHVHDETCRVELPEPWIDPASAVAYCGIPAHAHRDVCRDEEGNVVCGLEEHIHTEECYEETGYGCISRIHIHEAGCYDAEGNVQCGLADYVMHTHSPMCYGLGGKLLCTLPEVEAHVHGDACYTRGNGEEEPVLTCTLPEAEVHQHTDACRDENGNLVCGRLQMEEHEHTQECILDGAEITITQTYKGPDFIITAAYNKKEANLPEEATLFAERIPEEGNEMYYAERAAQYQEIQGEETGNVMQLLMRIGFAYEGAEVEPEAPVTIKIQLLGEDGMAEGSPVTVVHFGEGGNERLEGSDAEKNSTTFQLNDFSEIALGWKVPVSTVAVDKTFTYEDDAFTVTFHVEGEAVLPTAEEIAEGGRNPAGETGAGGENTVGEPEGEENGEPGTGENGDSAPTIPEGAGEADPAETNTGDVTNEELEAVVEPLGEEAAEYEAVAAYAAETDADNEILSLQVLSYGLTYQGAKLDLTDCKVTVEVAPTEALKEFAEGGEANVMAIDADADENAVEGTDPEAESPDSDVALVALDLTENEEGFQVSDIHSSLVVNSQTADTVMTYETTAQGTENTAPIYASSTANPRFTVEYYANIESVVTTHEPSEKAITMIDTSKQSEEGEPILPTNGGTMPKMYFYVSEEDGMVLTQSKETEIYSPNEYYYIDKPGLVYFNKVANNPNYILAEIRVQRKDSEAWESYSCADGKEWHFTNRKTTQEENKDEFILVTDGATIRLLFHCQEKAVTNSAEFYDYDVSDGQVYSKNGTAVNRDTATTHESGEKWYMYTNRQGINGNLPDQTFGFGNSEGSLKTTMGEIEGNKANAKNVAYGSPTFGLVTGMADGKIQYSDDVKAPNLFNDGDASGKTVYDGNLIFKQVGDTYTLTDAEVMEVVEGEKKVVSGVYGVDQFKRQMLNWGKTYYFAGNDFYPLDGVSTAGTGGHDLMFGSEASSGVIRSFSNKNDPEAEGCVGNVVASDDKHVHNHYFGMHYTVDFTLSKDYTGPLEYLFYGDDDMWVFLDGPGYDGKLICDIGGVHTSVGEYVNLWDHIKQGSEGEYRLTFFYTERGAGGSTCWMQFTLPSVSFATTEQDIGKLRIQKQVTGNAQTDEEFGFEIHFYRPPKEGEAQVEQIPDNALKNDYSYTKYNAAGEILEKDVLIWNDSKFTLKAGEYIIIDFLPDGSSYVIEEVGPVTVYPKKPDEDINWDVADRNPYSPVISGGTATEKAGKITGTIAKDSTAEIAYNNLYEFSLPETGSFGTTNLYALAGVMVILSGAGLVYRKKSRERRA